MPRAIRLFTAVVAAALIVASAQAAAAAPPQVVDQRIITLPDMRIIAISPDGSAIAAATWNRDELCVYETETLVERFCADMAPLDATLRVGDVVWSPDSSKLALAEESFRYYVDGDLWVLDAVTGELTNLTDEPYLGSVVVFGDKPDPALVNIDIVPTWLPDSSGITFSRSTWRNGETAGNAIYTVPVGGGEPTLETIVTLDLPGVVYFSIAWADDRSALYYSFNSPNTNDPNNGVWRVDANGLNATQIIGMDDALGAPSIADLSPDGKTLLVFYPMAAGQYGPTADDLYALVDTETGAATPLIADHDVPGGVLPALLSPDGSYVVYAARLTEPDFQVFARPVAGGDETVLTPDGIEIGVAAIDINAKLTWSDTGVILLTSPLMSDATLLTVDLGAPSAPGPTGPAETQPAPATPAAATDPALGETVVINDNDVPMRAEPSVDAETVRTLTLGAELRVLGEPIDADGFTWIPVGDLETTTVGYVRAEFLNIDGSAIEGFGRDRYVIAMPSAV